MGAKLTGFTHKLIFSRALRVEMVMVAAEGEIAEIARGTHALLCTGLAGRPWGGLPGNCLLCRSWLIFSPLFASVGVRREVINKVINSLFLSLSHWTVKVCFN